MTTEIAIPGWVRSRRAKAVGAGGLLFLTGLVVGESGGGTPTAASDPAPDDSPTVAAPPTRTVTATVTEAAPAVTVPGPTQTLSVPGPTVTVVKTVRVSVRAAAPQPLVQAPKDVYYANCSEARAAGDTPLYRGDPGYASHLDRDNDGVACE